jgi:RimJ/RimL family protein N-acetyltransferase
VDKTGDLVCRTERTGVYTITPADAPFFLELLNTPGWLKNIGDRGVHDLAQAEAYVRRAFIDLYQELGFGYYVIRDHNQTAIGVAGFLKKAYLENVDFGFAFLPKYIRQGYALEVSRAMLDYAEKELELRVLDAVTLEKNTASKKLLEKLGFIQLGNIEMPDDPAPVLLYRLTIGSKSML